MDAVFAACRKFDSNCGDEWSRFVHWSGFHHIEEIVSVDTILCPSLIDTLIDDDWEFNIHSDYRTSFFHDHEYLKRRVKYDSSRHNILALTEFPTHLPAPPNGFIHCGYDILDSFNSNSVLTNCGKHPTAYTTTDLNRVGLVDDLDRVTCIAEAIRDKNPDDDHCSDCRVWGIARYVSTTEIQPTSSR